MRITKLAKVVVLSILMIWLTAGIASSVDGGCQPNEPCGELRPVPTMCIMLLFCNTWNLDGYCIRCLP